MILTKETKLEVGDVLKGRDGKVAELVKYDIKAVFDDVFIAIDLRTTNIVVQSIEQLLDIIRTGEIEVIRKEKKWVPILGEPYYCWQYGGGVWTVASVGWTDTIGDNNKLKYNNVFPTKEEALKHKPKIVWEGEE